MKKIYLSLALLAFTALSFGQDFLDPIKDPVQDPIMDFSFRLSDTLIDQNQDTIDPTQLYTEDMTVFARDANDNLTKFGLYEYNQGAFAVESEFNFSYGYTGANITTMRRIINFPGQQYQRHATYTYDGNVIASGFYLDSVQVSGMWFAIPSKDSIVVANGQMMERYTMQGNFGSNTFEFDSRRLYTYNAAGQNTSVTKESYDDMSSTWTPDERFEFTFWPSGKVRSRIFMFLNGNNWEPGQEDRYYYNANGQLIGSAEYLYAAPQTLVESDSTSITYNSNGVDQIMEFVYNNNQWEIDSRTDIIYSGTKMVSADTYNWFNGAYEPNIWERTLFSGVGIITGGGGTAPQAPSDIIAMAQKSGNGKIIINWTDNSTNEDGFVLEYSLDGANFMAVDTVAADSPTYYHTNLADSTEHFYRVYAFNSIGASWYSNVTSTTTYSASVPTAVVSTQQNAFKLYPNPAKDFVVVENAKGTVISIADITGKTVLQQQINQSLEQINLTHLPSGLYFMRANQTVLPVFVE